MTKCIILLSGLLLLTAGCTSEAVFSDVDAGQVAALMADNMEPGRPKLIKRYMFAVDYQSWLKVDKTWTGKVSATAKCTGGSHFSSLQTHRYPEQEKMILSELIERVLRETDGKLVSCSVSGLRNIQPVNVRVEKDRASARLYGVSQPELLKTLKSGLSDIIWHRDHRPGGDYRELENGFQFSMQPTHTMGSNPYMVQLTIEHDAPSHVIRAVAWDAKKPDELLDSKQLESLVRQATIYLLGRHDKLKTSLPKP